MERKFNVITNEGWLMIIRQVIPTNRICDGCPFLKVKHDTATDTKDQQEHIVTTATCPITTMVTVLRDQLNNIPKSEFCPNPPPKGEGNA